RARLRRARSEENESSGLGRAPSSTSSISSPGPKLENQLSTRFCATLKQLRSPAAPGSLIVIPASSNTTRCRPRCSLGERGSAKAKISKNTNKSDNKSDKSRFNCERNAAAFLSKIKLSQS